MGTTNILDLNNRLTKVEKENVAQNSYTSLKNKPKINGVTLTGNKSLADIGAAAAADLTNKATIPSVSDSSLGTITSGNSENFTVTDDGYIAIYCNSGSTQKTFSAVIRDSEVLRYGVFVTATLPAYNSEAIGGLFVKKGRTYSVRNVGVDDITVYLCI